MTTLDHGSLIDKLTNYSAVNTATHRTSNCTNWASHKKPNCSSNHHSRCETIGRPLICGANLRKLFCRQLFHKYIPYFLNTNRYNTVKFNCAAKKRSTGLLFRPT